MKMCLVFAIFLIVFLIVNSSCYAQSYNLQQFYNQTLANQNILPSSNSLILFNQSNYFPDYTQTVYNYQNSSSFLKSSNFNINTSGSWLNHPPVPIYSPTSPMVMKAGQSSTFNYWVVDPDADQLYSSSNFGSTGQYVNGILGWSFSPNFPGQYSMQTVAYDERGGFAIMRSPVFVKPWWSF